VHCRGNGAYSIYHPEGARLFPGRWNAETSPTIYTSEHYSTAMLEKVAHANSVLPPNHHYIRITIPYRVSYEVFQTARHPGWDAKNETICKTSGEPGIESNGAHCCSFRPYPRDSNATS